MKKEMNGNDKFTWKNGDLEVVKLVINGKEVDPSALRQTPGKIFGFSKRPTPGFILEGTRLAIYDGPGQKQYAEYSEGLDKIKRKRISSEQMDQIRAVLDNDILYETEELEDPYGIMILDGTGYEFYFATKDRKNEMHGSNIDYCREDFEHCLHSAHAIRALEEIRDILDGKGIPKKYFDL